MWANKSVCLYVLQISFPLLGVFHSSLLLLQMYSTWEKSWNSKISFLHLRRPAFWINPKSSVKSLIELQVLHTFNYYGKFNKAKKQTNEHGNTRRQQVETRWVCEIWIKVSPQIIIITIPFVIKTDSDLAVEITMHCFNHSGVTNTHSQAQSNVIMTKCCHRWCSNFCFTFYFCGCGCC